jgi:hypothetical protein
MKASSTLIILFSEILILLFSTKKKLKNQNGKKIFLKGKYKESDEKLFDNISFVKMESSKLIN